MLDAENTWVIPVLTFRPMQYKINLVQQQASFTKSRLLQGGDTVYKKLRGNCATAESENCFMRIVRQLQYGNHPLCETGSRT